MTPPPPAAWPLPGAPELRDELLAAWGEPSRGYHDQRHLGEVLARLDELAAHGEPFDPLTVGLAAWFHDAVYRGAPDDEERSARWAERALAGLVPPPAVTEVARLVRLTATHRAAEDDPDGRALSDADLAILAAPAPRYDEYARTVRADFAHVPEADFRAGRARLLAELAARPALFHTPHARRHWDAPARANLAREIAALTG